MKNSRVRPLLDFPEASALYARSRADGVHFAARCDEAPVSMWWHFALEGLRGAPVPMVWERTHEVLGPGGLASAVPVYRTRRGWRRVPVASCRYEAEASELRFEVPAAADRVEVAYCTPYGLDRVQALLAALGRHPDVRVRVIGESEHGRPFPLVEMGHGETHVWLAARHHAGEVPGAYVLEGLLREAVRQPGLLERVTIHAVPVVDVDGVAEGMYGKERRPRDFNRDYVATPSRPEVAALTEAAEAVGRADIYVDFHAPCAGDHTFLVPVSEPLTTLAYWDEVWELGRWLEAQAPAACPCRVADLSRASFMWSGDLLMQTSTDYFHRRFGTLAMTLETSYHRAWNGRLLSPSGWQGLGRALLGCLAAKVGERAAPDVAHIAPPPSLVPRPRHWACVTWPPPGLRERRDGLEISSADSTGAGVMYERLLNDEAAAQLGVLLDGEAAALTVTAKGFDPRSGRPTGEVRTISTELQAAGREQTIPVPRGLPCYRLICRVNGLRGTLHVRPPR